ncbi:MAG: galactokinase [Clostridia bacterium]|nr:galactokinase [Clostridia bacterium]
MKKPYQSIDNQIIDQFPALYGGVSEFQVERYKAQFERFKKEFSACEAFVASSSGRVEVCGNHTDHNGGKVVCASINLDTLAMFLPTDNNIVHIKSEGYKDVVLDLNCNEKVELGTSLALVKGVAEGLKSRGYSVGGFNACFTSNVIGGAGISSSASFEVLIAEIFNFLYNDGKIDCQTKSIVSQFAENVYFGKPCGLLDQTAIAFGGINKLDFADKNTIKVEKIECDLSDFALVLINTGGDHSDLTDEYASIPAEMKAVAKCFGVERLVEIDKQQFLDGFSSVGEKVNDRAMLRATHFYEENERVDRLADALTSGNYSEFFDCINQSGISSLCALQNCYVSGSNIQSIPKAIYFAKNYLCGGANRVHGGGFAGSTLNVVKKENLSDFIDNVAKVYGKNNVIPLSVRTVGTIVL